jgi:hypothetical protein
MSSRYATVLGIVVLGCVAGNAAAQDIPPAPTPITPPSSPDLGRMPAPVTTGTSSSVSVWSTGCQLTPAGPDDLSADEPWEGHFVAGAGLYWIHPNFTNNPAYGEVRSRTVSGVPASVLSVQDFRYGMDFAPEVWLGYVTTSGLGVRVRWWQFDQGSGENLVNNGTLSLFSAAPVGLGVSSTTAGDVFKAYSDLKINLWDFEATQSVKAGCWELLFSGGGRYCFMSQDYWSSVVTAAGVRASTLQSGHIFNGGGPTAGFEARRPFGAGLAFYSKARATLLFGNDHQEAFLNEFTGGTLTSISDNSTNHLSVLPVAELELGAEYGYDLGQVRLVAQAGVVGQAWFGAGNAANANSGLATDNSSNLGFIGMVFRAGVTY